MKQLAVNDIAKHFGASEIFSNISFSVNSGDRLGIVGPNGGGKTTLLKCILGYEEISSGHIKLEQGVTIGYIPQNPSFDPQETVLNSSMQYIAPLEKKLRTAEQLLAAVISDDDLERAMNRYQQARDAWDLAEGDTAEDRARTLLSSMGLGEHLVQKTGTLSGGEKSILLLAAALLQKPAVLVLDEPGNHLDFQGFDWLEEFLLNFSGTIITVSHNRYFLDRICTEILEISGGQGTLYSGNYSDYRFRKMQEALSQQVVYNQQQRNIRQLEEMVRRFREIASVSSDPGWGKRLRAAKSRLIHEQSHSVDRPGLDQGPPSFSIKTDLVKGNIALQLNSCSVEIDGKKLIEGTDIELQCGQKAGIIGPNGSGKTTLLKKILERNDWNSREIRIGPSLKVGYIAQNPEFADTSRTLEEEVRSWGPLTRDQAYSLIKPMNFSWEALGNPVKGLSGGELRRVQLAKCIYERASFLILDEPTNHLDLPSREAVEEALIDYEGTVFVVSHDRYFLDRIAERIFSIEEMKLTCYEGNFTHFWKESGLRKTRSDGRIQNRDKEHKKAFSGSSNTRPGIDERSRQKEAALLEKRIEGAETERRVLERDINAAFVESQISEGRRLAVKLEKLNRLIEKLYNEWESLES
jgi:ATP-binding cassette, subfamily F, member 3